MEALTPIKMPELTGSGMLEETLPDSTSPIFARVLAQQAAKAGPGLEPAAANSDGAGKGLLRGGNEETLLNEAVEGPCCGDQLLGQVAPVLIPPSLVTGAIQDPPFPSGTANRGPNFSGTVAPGPEPGRPADSGPRPLIAPAAASEGGLKMTGGEGNLSAVLTAPVNFLNSPPSGDTASIPDGVPDGSRPPTKPGFATAAPETEKPFQGLVLDKGKAVQPSSANGAGDLNIAKPSQPVGPETAGENDGRGFEAVEVFREDPSPFPSPQARSAGRISVATELGRSPTVLAEGFPPENPSPYPGAGSKESPKPILSDPAGIRLPEANPAREVPLQGMTDLKSVLSATSGATGQAPAGGPLRTFPGENHSAADPEPLFSATQTKAALDRPPAAENLNRPADAQRGPGTPAASGPGIPANFFTEEIKVGTGMKAAKNPAAVFRAAAPDFSLAAKALAPEEAVPEKMALFPAAGERAQTAPPATEWPGMVGADEGAPAGFEGPVPAPAEGPSTLNIPLPVEPGMAAGRSPGPGPIETELKISNPLFKELFSEPAEGKNPLYKQIGQGLVWSLQRGEDKIQLTLDPPQLGTIFLELHRKGQTVEAQVWTDNPGTKGLLDSQQGQLQRALEQEGFRLDRFEVAVQPDLKSFQEGRWAQGRQPAWSGPQGRNGENPEETARSPMSEQNLSRFQSGNQFIDTWI
jgi:hypothetical protein